MTLFYLGPYARVTHEVFEARTPQVQSFAIRELRRVHAVVHRSSPLMTAPAPVRICSTVVAAAAAVVAGAGWSIFHRPAVSLAAVAVLGTASLVWLAGRVPRRVHELRAIYRGRLVCLFQTPDRLAFGQVSRALKRVLERMDEARPAA